MLLLASKTTNRVCNASVRLYRHRGATNGGGIVARVFCSKCGATGRSKCPVCRTVFPANQYEATLSYTLKWKYEDGRVTITSYHCVDNDDTGEKEAVTAALKALHKTLQNMADNVLDLSFEQYACNHTWRLAHGEKTDIDCGHCLSYRHDS